MGIPSTLHRRRELQNRFGVHRKQCTQIGLLARISNHICRADKFRQVNKKKHVEKQ